MSRIALGLPDKTRSDEDDARGQFDPAQKPPGRPIPTPRDPTKLSEEVMAPLHRLTNRSHSRLLLAAAGGPHAEARRLRPLPGRSVAVGPVGPCCRQAPWVDFGGRRLRLGRANHQRLQNVLGLTSVIGVGSCDHGPQRHSPVVAGQVQRRAAFAPVDRRRAGLFTPFFDGFLEPSRRT